MMIEHPYWFILILFPILIWLFRKRNLYYLKHPYINAIQHDNNHACYQYFLYAALVCLILAAMDINFGYTEKIIVSHARDYVLVDDASSSMLSLFFKDGQTVMEKGLRTELMLNGNHKFLDSLQGMSDVKHSVGLITFSDMGFVASYLSDDIDFVRQKLDNVLWDEPPLAGGTRVDAALCVAINVILKNNSDYGGLTFSDNERELIAKNLYGSDNDFKIPELKSKTDQIREQVKGATIIIFTDGEITFDGNDYIMSIVKILKLCKNMGIEVYMLNLYAIPSRYKMYFAATGGESIMIGEDKNSFVKAYQKILDKTSREKTIVDKTIKKNYSLILGYVSFFLLIIVFFLKFTSNRNITEL